MITKTAMAVTTRAVLREFELISSAALNTLESTFYKTCGQHFVRSTSRIAAEHHDPWLGSQSIPQQVDICAAATPGEISICSRIFSSTAFVRSPSRLAAIEETDLRGS
jgi:hypothetical protein